MLAAADLDGIDPTLALRIIAHATGSIAPGLDSVPAGTDQWDRIIAVLKGVAAEAQPRGSRLIASQGVGGASISYRNVDSWFSSDDRASLRAACQVTSAAGAPLGSFPRPSVIGRLWPGDDYS